MGFERLDAQTGKAAMIRQFITAQALGVLICFLPVGTHYITLHSLLSFALLQGAAAAAVSVAMGSPRWWRLINFSFMPAVVVALAWHAPPEYYLLAFLLLILVFWNTLRERVPLYLTNQTTLNALSELIRSLHCERFMDVGSGTGTVLVGLARRHPGVRFGAVESAPLPWLVGRVRLLFTPNVETFYADLWSTSLEAQDMVYAFLSPEPMGRLWEKCCTEMRPGSWLVSNSFQILGVEPSRVVQLEDRRKTSLYIYECGSDAHAQTEG